MPDQGIDGPMAFSLTASLPLNRDDVAKCLGIAGENAVHCSHWQAKNAKSTSYCDPALGCARQQFSRCCRF